MKQEQWKGQDRKAQFLDIGARLASKHGAANVTRRMVASEARVTDPLVSVYMGSVDEARAAYRKHCKKLGLPHPGKNDEAELGMELRRKPRK